MEKIFKIHEPITIVLGSAFTRNTDKLLWSDEKIIGGKTRYTRRAGHCFVCAAWGEEKTILVAVLGSPRREKPIEGD